jgi:hypothetical protein
VRARQSRLTGGDCEGEGDKEKQYFGKKSLKDRGANSTRHQRLSPGWTERKIRAVIAHYDSQTDDERPAEIDKAAATKGDTLVSVPNALVPAVVDLIRRFGKSA